MSPNTQEVKNYWRIGRKIIKYGGRIALAAAVLAPVADVGTGYLKWQKSAESIEILDTDNDIKHDNLWVVAPGLGVHSGKQISKSLEPALSAEGDIAYLVHSNDATNPLNLAEDIRELAKDGDYKTITFLASSMGVAEVLEMYVNIKAAGVRVTEILFDCPPTDDDDILGKGKDVIKVLEKTKYPGGLLSKLGVQVYQWTLGDDRNNKNPLSHQLWDAWRVTTDDSSPRTWTSRMRNFAAFNLANYANVIDDDVKITFLMPDNPSNDKVVNLTQSLKRIQDTFGADRVTVAKVVGARHASPNQFPDAYIQAIRYRNMPDFIRQSRMRDLLQ